MHIPFHKYQGAGNDFVILDGRKGLPKLNQKDIHFLCHRRFGIGADGLMVLEEAPGYDFGMRYYNADGLEGSMCGNGGRCLVAYATQHQVGNYVFLAIDGRHEAQVLSSETGTDGGTQVRLGMKPVHALRLLEQGYFLDTGSPHFVLFVDELENLDVYNVGKCWRRHPHFAPGGCNVNFVQEEADGSLSVRTFERGVEDETLACGTGVTASALAACVRSLQDRPQAAQGLYHYALHARGGELQVDFQAQDGCFTDVWLTGPATLVYHGEIEIPILNG